LGDLLGSLDRRKLLGRNQGAYVGELLWGSLFRRAFLRELLQVSLFRETSSKELMQMIFLGASHWGTLDPG
jgi:hypothetical protein